MGRGNQSTHPTAMRQTGQIEVMEFSPDGTSLVTAGGEGVKFWDAVRGVPAPSPVVHRLSSYGVTFSKDGRLLAAGSGDGRVRVWDVSTGELVAPPMAHSALVVRVAFSAGDDLLAAVSGDGTARVWDVGTGKPLGPALQHEGWVWRVGFHPDGKRLMTGTSTGVCVWASPEWFSGAAVLKDRTLAALGMRLDERGQVEVLSKDEWAAYVEDLPRDARPQAPASLAGHGPR